MPTPFISHSESDTDQLGRAIAAALQAGDVVSLSGTLGAGKTRLVQAVAAGLGVDPKHVTSPTFVLVNEYVGGRLPLYHWDVYRLKDDDEFLELGPEEYFEGPGATFLEWGDRVSHLMPKSRTTISIEIGDDQARHFTIDGPLAERIAVTE